MSLLLFLACFPHNRAGAQVREDGTDTAADTSTDTAADTSTDTAADTSTDTAADTSTDTAADTSTDTAADTGTEPVCDPSVPATILGVTYGCQADQWSVRWALAGPAASVRLVYGDLNGKNGGTLTSDNGDMATGCCEEPKYKLWYSCTATMNAVLYVYDAAGAQVDCVQFGNFGAGMACRFEASTAQNCTP